MIAENHPYREDLKLISDVRSGNRNAFNKIVLKYQDDVARVVIGMLGKNEDAEDVGQEVFIRFYNSIEQYQGASALKTYLTRIAMNLSINRLNQLNKRKVSSLDDRFHPPVSTQNEGERLEHQELIEKSLTQLDPEHREVIVLRLIQGYSTKETAKQLDIPLGTVLSRLSRAQAKMKLILEKLGWDENK